MNECKCIQIVLICDLIWFKEKDSVRFSEGRNKTHPFINLLNPFKGQGAGGAKPVVVGQIYRHQLSYEACYWTTGRSQDAQRKPMCVGRECVKSTQKGCRVKVQTTVPPFNTKTPPPLSN